MAKGESKLSQEEVDNLGVVVPHLTHLMYMVAMVVDMMVIDVDRRLHDVNKRYGLRQEVKMRMSGYVKKVKECMTYFENFIEPTIIDNGRGNQWQDYEISRIYANELARVIMLYYEKTVTKESSDKVFDFLVDLPEERHAFTASVINHYNIK